MTSAETRVRQRLVLGMLIDAVERLVPVLEWEARKSASRINRAATRCLRLVGEDGPMGDLDRATFAALMPHIHRTVERHLPTGGDGKWPTAYGIAYYHAVSDLVDEMTLRTGRRWAGPRYAAREWKVLAEARGPFEDMLAEGLDSRDSYDAIVAPAPQMVAEWVDVLFVTGPPMFASYIPPRVVDVIPAATAASA